MLRKRVIAAIPIQDGRTVDSGVARGPQLSADPVERASRYEAEGADALLFIDASQGEQRQPLLDVVRRTSARVGIPIVVSGGMTDLDAIADTLHAGATKAALNTGAVLRPEFLAEAVERFGSASIITSIAARAERRQIEMMARPDDAAAPVGAATPQSWFRVFTHRGTTATQMDATVWARRCAEMGASELIVRSIDHELADTGYDLELTARIVEAVQLPVVARGGATRMEHVRDAFLLAGADAAITAEMRMSIDEVKRKLQLAGISVRIPQVSGILH